MAIHGNCGCKATLQLKLTLIQTAPVGHSRTESVLHRAVDHCSQRVPDNDTSYPRAHLQTGASVTELPLLTWSPEPISTPHGRKSLAAVPIARGRLSSYSAVASVGGHGRFLHLGNFHCHFSFLLMTMMTITVYPYFMNLLEMMTADKSPIVTKTSTALLGPWIHLSRMD